MSATEFQSSLDEIKKSLKCINDRLEPLQEVYEKIKPFVETYDITKLLEDADDKLTSYRISTNPKDTNSSGCPGISHVALNSAFQIDEANNDGEIYSFITVAKLKRQQQIPIVI